MSKKRWKTRGQMSESMLTIAFLTLSGGLQDAYSYCVRGKVFANAQTGNIVLMSGHFFEGEWAAGLQYLIPILFFAFGVFAAEQVRDRFRKVQRVHWRQLIVIGEILLLFLVGFLPERMDLMANSITSFACAMQVQTFRKVNGCAFASTMCIGNLRSGVEAFCRYEQEGDRSMLVKGLEYFGVIGLFAVGAGAGSRLAGSLGARTIWVCCALLLVSFTLMFIREDIENR
ncbi:MAG: YoaK family protein [Lachnospiraceae bacterium]|nr:YoaK family protein [Lachnospiraceae bacterium]MDY4969120.1 YoaK family protein [Lachnospiraceae bacterium]